LKENAIAGNADYMVRQKIRKRSKRTMEYHSTFGTHLRIFFASHGAQLRQAGNAFSEQEQAQPNAPPWLLIRFSGGFCCAKIVG
jgi:hypothetical protein